MQLPASTKKNFPTARSTSFASFDFHVKSSKGINGALTPARKHQSLDSKFINDINPTAAAAAAATHPATPAYPSDQTPSRLLTLRQEDLVGGGGISLQETDARIHELERSEFDLKLQLFYMQERLESAADGVDALQLHKELMEAKLHRSKAEDAMRAAGEALSGLEAKCKELQTKARDAEAQRTKDQENLAIIKARHEERFKRHTSLLEETLRVERAENARLRLEIGARSRGSWNGGGGGRGGESAAALRRKSTGEDSRAQLGPWRGSGGSSSGGGGFVSEHREQQQQLEEKLRIQDSALRSLRADVTTLRRRLRAQADALREQRAENDVIRRAAEEVACVEAEEIARLAVDLERAVRVAKAEGDRRQDAEHRLVAAETRLSEWETGARDPAAGSSRRRSRSPIRSPRPSLSGSRSPRDTEAGGRSEATEAAAAATGEGTPAKLAKFRIEDVLRASADLGVHEGAMSSPGPPAPSGRGALGSTVASRARCVKDKPAAAAAKHKGRSSSTSPTRGPGTEGKGGHRRRPWGSSPPPSPHRGSSESVANGRRPLAGYAGAVASSRHRQRLRRHSGEQEMPRHSSGGGREAEETPPFSANGRVGGTAVAAAAAAAATASPALPHAAEALRRSDVGGEGGGRVTSVAIAAAIRGVDLTAAIARELRAAVATTPASSAVSPGSRGGFSVDGGGGASSGQNTPAGGNGDGGRKNAFSRVDRYGRRRNSKTFEGDEDPPSNFTRRGAGSGQQSAWGGREVDTDAAAATTTSGGRTPKSREVADLESDVQHIFRFFAAKDGPRHSGSPLGRDQGDGGGGGGGGGREIIGDIHEAFL